MADLSSKTKNEIFDLIKRAAQEIYPDAEWTGLRTGSFEWLMSQIVAEVSVLNGQYLDLRANNAYLSSLNLKEILLAILLSKETSCIALAIKKPPKKNYLK